MCRCPRRLGSGLRGADLTRFPKGGSPGPTRITFSLPRRRDWCNGTKEVKRKGSETETKGYWASCADAFSADQLPHGPSPSPSPSRVGTLRLWGEGRREVEASRSKPRRAGGLVNE